jgi:hypothetical protein
LDLTHQPYTKVGWIDVPSGTNANGIFVANDIAYVTSSNKLYTFNVSTKTGAHSTVISQATMWIGIGATPLAKQVAVVGSRVFVGTANTLFGLQVFTVDAGGANLKLGGVSNLTWQQASQGLSVNADGTRAYIAFNNGAGFFPRGFFIVDTTPTDPPWWWPFPNFYDIIGTYNAGGTDPKGMAIAPGPSNRALLVGTGGVNQYQVIDISNETNPVFCGGLSIASGVSGVTGALDQYSNVYSYIISGEAKDQFKIIKGGNGGGIYATSGTFESSTFDPGYQTAFNRFTATVSQPALTTLQMQVAVAPAISNSCNGVSFNYVGPDGTSASYFTPSGSAISAIIPYGTFNPNYQNPARCFRYKLWYNSTNSNTTPVFNDVTVNYSP